MVSRRLSREAGHRRKFLAIIDETPESHRAVAYASRRAKNTNGTLVLLFIIDNSYFQHILGVSDIMRAEAEERAQQALKKVAADVYKDQRIKAEKIVREGTPIEEIAALIEEDRDIAVLVLAAGSSSDGPGPLVQAVAGRDAAFPIPVTIVPDSLGDDEIDTVA